MPARIQLADHLTSEELEQRYRAAKRPTESRRFQVLWLLSKGWHSEDIAKAVGYTVIRVRKLAGFYYESRPEAMLDGRRNTPCQDQLLHEDGVAAVRQAIENEEPPDGPQWNGPKVAVWMT